MRTHRITLLVVLIAAILIACGPTPTPTNGIWDQSNFETANWN